MFAIEELWKAPSLAPLKKVYDANPTDRRLVVATDASNKVSIAETVALHSWLEKQGYQRIPTAWESSTDLDLYQVIHVSQLSIEVLRNDPFSLVASPLTPNSWLNQLPQERFDALLLAQERGDVPMHPTRIFIKDTLKPALESPTLSAFWTETLADVTFAQSGQPPRNEAQKQTLHFWAKAVKRRHYDPTSDQPQPRPAPQQPAFTPQEYVWNNVDIANGWSAEMTALRDWIDQSCRTTADLQNTAEIVLGSLRRVNLNGNKLNQAHEIVAEAGRANRLSALAAAFQYVQPAAKYNVSINGSAINTIVNTGGGAHIAGNVNTFGGDLVLGNKTVYNR